MIEETQVFSNPEFGTIRTVEVDGEPWLVGKDVARALGYRDTDKAIRDHVDDEDKKVLTRKNSGFEGRSENAAFDIPNRGLTIISKFGAYSLIYSSKLPRAKQFKSWFTFEVLPSVQGRRNSTYQKPDRKDMKSDKLRLSDGKNVQSFLYNEIPVRTVILSDEPWWVLADVCRVLELSNPSKVAERLDDDEKMTLTLSEGHSGQRGGAQKATIISESGLYKVILRSDKPEAKKFTRWVTHEVLPSIRKHGGYIDGQEAMSDLELLSRAILVAQSEIENRDKLIAEQGKQIEDMLPAKMFADAVTSASDAILVGEMARILKQNGIDIGQNKLFSWLRDNGYLIRRRGTDYNSPTQRSMKLGLFSINESVVDHPDGHKTISRTSKVTGKGQQYFVEKFLMKEIPG